jgi:prepilin-type N-terminal cleavage/methylation domain-containing protein
MKITHAEPWRQTGGFTLIEMIGVLSVIAILAGLLIPKVTSAISDARINSTVGSFQTARIATTAHYAKYNAFNVTNTSASGNGNSLATQPSTTAPFYRFDTPLIAEGFLDQPFAVKVGTTAVLQVVPGEGSAGTAALAGGGTPAGYKLNGSAVGTSINAFTVEAVISGVSPQDAFDVASRIDGNLFTNTVPGVASFAGARCNYYNVGGGTLYLYVNGR